MVHARLAALRSGAFDSLVAVIRTATDRSVARSAPQVPGEIRLVDLGSGPGFYAAAATAGRSNVAVLVADRSPAALRASRAMLPHAERVVLDLWRPLPLNTACADVALNIFAPRNAEEYARIIRPGGTLIVAVPRANHLVELRDAPGMLSVPAGKRQQVAAQFAQVGFGVPTVTAVHDSVWVDGEIARHLAEMGPSAHHLSDSPDKSDQQRQLTVAVDVMEFVRVSR
ncbi:MAG TPA: hypothetical protein VFU07_06015 [Candidatus Lumbricidophila sp.]|nr:hypothetical protein [Candidatus Lumbricidophila sp.]